MNTAILHDAAEELAAYLSEVTVAELRHPVQPSGRTLGALTLDLMHRHLRTASAVQGAGAQAGELPDPPTGEVQVPTTLAELETRLHPDGTGVETTYRRVAHTLLNAFDTADVPLRDGAGSAAGRLTRHHELPRLHDREVAGIVLHTWDVASALDLPYRPTTPVAWRVLRALTAPADPNMATDRATDRATATDSGSSALEQVPSVREGEAFHSVLVLTGRAA